MKKITINITLDDENIHDIGYIMDMISVCIDSTRGSVYCDKQNINIEWNSHNLFQEKIAGIDLDDAYQRTTYT